MIALVTDSTCDIPQELIEQERIHVIPALINIGQKTLRDGIDLTRDAFYEMLPSLPKLPTTSAPSPNDFIHVYEQALHRASQVVSIHVASRLSGIYNAARLAAQEVAPDRIHLVDTGLVSMGLGWAALSAAEAIRKSESLEGVLHSVEDTIRRVKLYAILNTLDYLSKSGRINMVQAGLASLLNVKPMVELRDGVVSTVARVRTWSKAVGELAERVRQLGALERLAVMHSNCFDCASDFIGRVKEIVPLKAGALITNVTTVIGTHVGPHALGVAAVVGNPGK